MSGLTLQKAVRMTKQTEQVENEWRERDLEEKQTDEIKRDKYGRGNHRGRGSTHSRGRGLTHSRGSGSSFSRGRGSNQSRGRGRGYYNKGAPQNNQNQNFRTKCGRCLQDHEKHQRCPASGQQC